MIVSALVQRYKDNPGAPVGWQRREASYALDIGEDGRLLDVIYLEREHEKAQGKKTKTIMIKREFILPLESGRSGLNAFETANFLCDDGGYMLGFDPRKFESARNLHNKLLETVNTPESRAVRAYFDSGPPAFPEGKIDIKIASIVKYVFQVNGKFIDYQNEIIRAAWDNYYEKLSKDEGGGSEKIRCLVTGEMDEPLYSHNVLKLRGGQSSGSRLISANSECFTSYGKTKNDRAADVGKYAAFAYVSSLSDLLKSDKNHILTGEDTLVYWAEKGGEAEEELMNLMTEARQEDSEKLNDVMEKIENGDNLHEEKINMERKFYLLCLSPAAGRISVRFFHSDNFGSIIANIVNHYQRMEIIGDGRTPFEIIPLWLLLKETTVKSSGDVSPLLGGQVLRSVLTGADYPATLYNAMITRIRAGEAVSKTKAAAIKAILSKKYKENSIESEVMTVSLNEESTIKPYVLGRLFAALEKLQRDSAGGSLNATIRDKYFATACANPGSVFPTLLRLSMHHSAKLDKPGYYEKLKTDLLGLVDVENPFPAALSLDEQGLFILGYYHQTQVFFTPKKDKEEAVINEQLQL